VQVVGMVAQVVFKKGGNTKKVWFCDMEVDGGQSKIPGILPKNKKTLRMD